MKDYIEKAIDKIVGEVSELKIRGDYPWYAKVDPQIADLSREARALADELRQSPGMAAGLGDLRIDFHLNTVISRMVNDWAGYPKSNVTFQKIPAEKLVSAYSLWKDVIADLVASLPDRNVRDARSGKMVDPFTPFKKAFPGGTPQKDLAATLMKAKKIFDDAWGRDTKRVNQATADRNYVNAMQLLQQVGAGSKEIEKGIDTLHREIYGMSTAELDKANRKAMGELEIDVGVGDADKQDFTGGSMYTKKESMSPSVDRMVDLGISMLADYNDNVDRVMDRLMSTYTDLEVEEWEEVEEELEGFVGSFDEAKLDNAIDSLLESSASSDAATDEEFVKWFMAQKNKWSPEEREDIMGSPDKLNYATAQNWIANLLDDDALKSEYRKYLHANSTPSRALSAIKRNVGR